MRRERESQRKEDLVDDLNFGKCFTSEFGLTLGTGIWSPVTGIGVGSRAGQMSPELT